MKKTIIATVMLFMQVQLLDAQNVGIGTTTPSARLEVRNAQKSVIKISSLDYLDSAHLVFSNRQGIYGTDMILAHNQETGLKFSSKSDLASRTVDNIMMLTPNGRVGIRNNSPAYPLDVNGDMNVTGELKTNGVGGAAGDVLQSNGNGTMSWVDKNRFKKFKAFRNTNTSFLTTVTSTFTFPVGVTEVAVEIWGGGGQGDDYGSGASGGYLYAIIPVGSNTALTVNVGAGGGCSVCNTTQGRSSSVTFPGDLLRLVAQGGATTSFLETEGTYVATGSYLTNVNYVGIVGQSAKFPELFYENSPLGYFIFRRNAKGGDAPLRPGSGGQSGWKRTNWDGSSPLFGQGFSGSEPGGGGGYPAGGGGGGLIIVYW